jgi:D-3-phosphoglycerate dehydrogenase
MSVRILVLEGITERGLELLEAEGWHIDQSKALPPAELAKKVADYDAIMVRSGSQITAEVLEAATRLKVIGRPGVGVDNVDVAAATRRGVVVMNSPGGNMVSTAELALALLFAVARNVAAADASMKARRWDRKSFKGVELHGKRLGVIGLGRIGREVASRARALGMKIAAYDPFVSAAVAESLQVEPLSLEELLQSSDFVTLHTNLSAETRHLIGKESLSRVKPGIYIVNAARGELIDDEALLEALESGRVAGAAIDVHTKEPPVDWRLATHPRVVATPHVGASTNEAQERVGTDIAIQVRDFLKGGVIQQAVNFFSFPGELFDEVRPALDLAERLGTLLAEACEGTPERLEIGLYGEFAELDVKPILSAAVTGVLRPALGTGVTWVNARSLAEERGLELVESRSSASVGFSNLLVLRLKTSEDDLSVAGTLFGRNHLRVVEIDGVELDAVPRGHLLFIKNEDTPGVIGHMGSLLGESDVNIARMTVGRKPGSNRAVMILEVDSEVPDAVLPRLLGVKGVRYVKAISLAP